MFEVRLVRRFCVSRVYSRVCSLRSQSKHPIQSRGPSGALTLFIACRRMVITVHAIVGCRMVVSSNEICSRQIYPVSDDL